MNWIETLLITLGISLDIFGIVTCEGALLAEIDKKRLAAGSLLVALLQTIALYLGDLVGGASLQYDIKDKQILTVRVIVAIIFIVLGVRMILKAWKNKSIVERREENGLSLGRILKCVGASSVCTLLVGVAFGFLGTNVTIVLIMVVCLTVLMVVFGLYTGYRFGFEQKTKAYSIGGVLLIIGGIDVVIRYIVH